MVRIETRLNALEKSAPSLSEDNQPCGPFFCETVRTTDEDIDCHCPGCEAAAAATCEAGQNKILITGW